MAGLNFRAYGSLVLRCFGCLGYCASAATGIFPLFMHFYRADQLLLSHELEDIWWECWRPLRLLDQGPKQRRSLHHGELLVLLAYMPAHAKFCKAI